MFCNKNWLQGFSLRLFEHDGIHPITVNFDFIKISCLNYNPALENAGYNVPLQSPRMNPISTYILLLFPLRQSLSISTLICRLKMYPSSHLQQLLSYHIGPSCKYVDVFLNWFFFVFLVTFTQKNNPKCI